MSKIRKGSYMVCLKDYKSLMDDKPMFTAGKIYKCLGLHERTSNTARILSMIDDRGEVNGWHEKFFEYVDKRGLSELEAVIYGVPYGKT